MFAFILAILNSLLRMRVTRDQFYVTLEQVDELADLFIAYRDNPEVLQFCAEMGDPDQSVFKSTARTGNYLRPYVKSDPTKYFDTVRKFFKVCKSGKFKVPKNMIECSMECAYSDMTFLPLCLPYTADFDESEMDLANILQEIGRKRGDIGDDGRLKKGGLATTPYMCKYGDGSDVPYQNKKYLMGLIRFDLLTATEDDKKFLIRTFGPLLSLQSLIELNSFASEHGLGECLFDIEELIYQKNKNSNNSTTSEITCIKNDDNDDFSDFDFGELFNYCDISKEILERLDWRTLWYSMPYVNKALCKTASRKFVTQRSGSLKEFLKQEAQCHNPERLFNMRQPWNTLFPSVHHLVKFYIDGMKGESVEDINPGWLLKIFEGLSMFKYDDELVRKALSLNNTFKSNLPFDSLVRLTNLFFSQLPEMAAKGAAFYKIDGHALVKLIGKVDQPVELYKFLSTHHINGRAWDDVNAKPLLKAILMADELDWPEEVIEMAEENLSDFYGTDIKLPYTAEQIRRLEPSKIRDLLHSHRDLLEKGLELKVLDALSSEYDSEALSALEMKDFEETLEQILYFPSSVGKQQFAAFLRRAIELLGDNESFQDNLLVAISGMRDNVEN